MRVNPAGILLLAFAAPASSATLVVLNKVEATASLIDLGSGKVVATLPPGEGPQGVADFGKSSVPIGIAISPDGKRAFVAHANADAISVIDLQTFTAMGTLKAGKEPDGMATSPVTVSR